MLLLIGPEANSANTHSFSAGCVLVAMGTYFSRLCCPAVVLPSINRDIASRVGETDYQNAEFPFSLKKKFQWEDIASRGCVGFYLLLLLR